MIDDHDGGVLAWFAFDSEVLPRSYVLERPPLSTLLRAPLSPDVSISNVVTSERLGTNLLIVPIVVLVSDDFDMINRQKRGDGTKGASVALTRFVVPAAEVGDCASLFVDEDVRGAGLRHVGDIV